MRHLVSILVLSLLGGAVAAHATCAPISTATASTLCTAPSGTCFIEGKQCLVVAGATLDFGARAVVLRQGTTLDVATGVMTILAGSLELQPGTALLGHGGSVVVQNAGPIAILRPSQGSPARIDVTDPVGANRIDLLSTAGTVQIDGTLDARGTNTDGSGGAVDITGATVLVTGDIRTNGGNVGIGGPVSIEAKTGGLLVSGNIDGFGGSGGSLDLTADSTVTTSGRIDIRATAAGGDGGPLTVFTTHGSVTLGGKIFMQGDEGTDLDGGANGGELDVFAAGALTLAAAFEITGAPPDGQGGDVLFQSGLDTVQTGTLLVQGRGAESDGGTIQFDSQGALILGPIDLHGGENLPDSGGALEATAWCDVTVPSGVTITAEGDRGSLHLLSGRLITAVGSLKAGSPILLEYRTLVPITLGGTFLPELDTPKINLTLTPCGGFAPPSCGDGVLDADEACDDHNTTSCDGCSSTCTIEGCGNGMVECAEQCDDGGTASCDGCSDACKIETCGNGVLDCGEQCDDQNTDACDGCSPTCQTEGCGNDVVECGEECEPPNVGGCAVDCNTFIPPGCGDGTQAGQEECDDGNVLDGDGCSHQCREERCGNGTLDPGETCDDFNVVGCDGCSPTCKVEACGNGVLDCSEECDDGAGNGAPGGSCLPDVCRPGPLCSTAGELPCIPCATTADCDPLNACGTAACLNGTCTPVAPPSCDDHDVCDGDETCDPAIGCKNGPALACNDHDACTDDGCDAVLGCTMTPFTGYALPECRLKSAHDLVVGATAAEIADPIRSKLLTKLGGIEGRLIAAEQAGSNTKKTGKSLKAAGRMIRGTIRLVTKQRAKKIAAPLADDILAALGALPPLLGGLTP